MPASPRRRRGAIELMVSVVKAFIAGPIAFAKSDGDRICHEPSPRRRQRLCNNGVILRSACLAGMGIMARSSFTLGDDFSSGRLVRLLKGYHLGVMSINLVYPSRRLMS